VWQASATQRIGSRIPVGHQNDDAATSQARYYAAMERLTAASWHRGEH
jgi:hypothetical protein